MKKSKQDKRPASCLWWLFIIGVVVLSLMFLTLNLYRPDNPVALIVPGSSAKPSFFVQVIRPREGLPVGGLLPPQLFGVDAELGFDSDEDGSTYVLGNDVIELSGDDWVLRLVFDQAGRVQPESEIEFDLTFEDQKRRVCCKPGSAPVGTFSIREIAADEFSGNFAIDFPICEDVETGTSLGWPPKPFLLRGSFDRLPRDSAIRAMK